ncbi:MAG: Gfo/Idh/MocA family oxidoreductase, partial [Phycisphaeraceae bacterium]|nr:Gfo/Idh/MocA family oxidoreductase [Phycisphaeraceae bacterium]
MNAYTRREFVKTSAAVTAAAAMAPLAAGRGFFAGGSDTIRVGVIGCGGRGTGAAFNAIEAAPNTTIVALADVMPDRVESCRGELTKLGDRVQVSDDRCFTGFDAYERLIRDGGVDCVILATPPHFRPAHLAAAVVAGKHVFMEKPVAVDPAGVRSVLASAMLAERKGLSIVAGTQRRHEACYIEAMARINGGALGRVVHASCYWNQGGLWVHD